jgi:hypothetical protein
VKRLLAALLALMLAFAVAACGRKGDPEAPSNVDPRFPRSYPGSAPRAPAPPPNIDNDFIPRTTP